jgi:non-heme chloroperoxidase
VAIKHLKINGAEVTYREEGAGVPVVLLNGMLGDYRGWQRQVDALSPQYRVLALSQRYFPPNKWPDDGAGWGPVNHVADLTVLLRQLGLPPVHLVGHSYGGAVAPRLAAEHPQLVRSLILGEPGLQNLALDHPAMPGLLNEFMDM